MCHDIAKGYFSEIWVVICSRRMRHACPRKAQKLELEGLQLAEEDKRLSGGWARVSHARMSS